MNKNLLIKFIFIITCILIISIFICLITWILLIYKQGDLLKSTVQPLVELLTVIISGSIGGGAVHLINKGKFKDTQKD